MNKLPDSLTQTINIDQIQTEPLSGAWNLVWRQRILYVKPCQGIYQPVALSPKYKKWLIDCLNCSSIKLVKIDPLLPKSCLIFWADACKKSNKPIYLWVSSLKNTSQISKPIQWRFKRAIDWIAGVIMIFCFIPPTLTFLLFSVKYKPKRIIIGEWQVGRRGKLFKGYRFYQITRNEYSSILEMKNQLNQNNSCRFKLNSLIHQFIYWMYQHRLDKIPQLLNVIQGDMSIVGRVPQDLYVAIEITRQAKEYISSIPGIINYEKFNDARMRPETSIDIDKRTVENCKYLDNWSLLNDLKVLLIFIYKSSILLYKKA